MHRSPSKRQKVFSESDDDEAQATEAEELRNKLQIIQKELFAVKAELKSVKSENRALEVADARMTNQYATLKSDWDTHKNRDRKVIRELNDKLSKFQSRATAGLESMALQKDMTHILDTVAETVERTVTDVSKEEDGADNDTNGCPICLDALLLSKCSLLPACGHYLHSACLASIPVDDLGETSCPNCRTKSKDGTAIKKLYNFDQGWEKLVNLSTQWRNMNMGDQVIPEAGSLTDTEDEAPVIEGDNYMSTDHEISDPDAYGRHPEPFIEEDRNSSSEDDENYTPPSTPPQNARMSGELTSRAMESAQRRKKMEELALRRSAKKRR